MEYLETYVHLTPEMVKENDWIIDKLSEILKVIHENLYVHGDFRYQNIMVDIDQQKIKMIDFEFGGLADRDVYPVDFNGFIDWHPGQKFGYLLMAEHDIHFFKRICNGESLERKIAIQGLKRSMEPSNIDVKKQKY
jgi:serine/threonine protein kinase